MYWGWRDLNPHASHLATDFKSVASTNSATSPSKIIIIVYHIKIKKKELFFFFIYVKFLKEDKIFLQQKKRVDARVVNGDGL